MRPYDEKDPKSIECYAKRLVDKSIRDLVAIDPGRKYRGKGELGQLLEDIYFEYTPNSISEPDFAEAGVELKTTPLKIVNNRYVSKERLVLNVINYSNESKVRFEESSFWKKNSVLLLMFYLHENGKLPIDLIFKICRLWKFPEADLKIIRDDWSKIVQKISDGKAHELSEGDTLYLGACTKGSTAAKSYTTQPYSLNPAKRRAYSLKSRYLNSIIDESLLAESEPVIKSDSELTPERTFEEHVIDRFAKFYGYTEVEIAVEIGISLPTSKHKLYVLARSILGVSKDRIQEFEKANVEMKTIRLEESGALKESMSFRQIQFAEIVNEVWENSYWLETLTKRFFFVVFQKDNAGALRLKKVMFWAMPVTDLEIARKFWEDTKAKILANDFDHFIKASENPVCHVRPKGRDSYDLMATATGLMKKKKSYWLNAQYIKKAIGEN